MGWDGTGRHGMGPRRLPTSLRSSLGQGLRAGQGAGQQLWLGANPVSEHESTAFKETEVGRGAVRNKNRTTTKREANGQTGE
ncbi:hypothetical protein DCS_07344 [Drechmeria coniospora]|uniref:Uncharacterized protein n=1 Tax=Drechmeria coniospora TaxID=98403 RepID=A0A151GE87_DRECN|nr:hypothetical protein DCS_07344 [Drechmeria coniospora]KYK55381.1 hypothetical protein DCS_07344 [Drechmeria coniospora]